MLQNASSSVDHGVHLTLV